MVRRRVMLDAGHGRPDPGNCRGGMVEADIVLDLTYRVGRLIRMLSRDEAGNPRIVTLFTRTDDAKVELGDRCRAAIKDQADLFVSLHTNAAVNPLAKGCEVFVSMTGSYSRESKLLAADICKRLEGCGFKNRGVKDGDKLAVIKGTKHHMLAVLIEPGFASNPTDAAKLRSKEGREVIAIQIASAVVSSFGIEPRMELING